MLEQSKKAALAWEDSYAPNLGSNIRSIEAFWELKSDLDILEQKDCNKKSIAKIQNLIIGNNNNLKVVFVKLVETKARKILARAKSYKASNSL